MACTRNPLVGALVAASLVFTSTSAVAATASAPVPAAQQVDPWAALGALSGVTSAVQAACGMSTAAAAATAAAQTPSGCVLPVTDAPPPPVQSAPPPPQPVPPVEPVGGGFGISPLLLGLIALAGGIALYFLLKDHGHDNDNEVSPA